MSSNLIYASTKVLPYVYRLTHKVTGQFYIGLRYANKVPSSDDLGTYYFSSSKGVKKLGFENFDIEVLAEFFDKHSAIAFEDILIYGSWGLPLMLNRNLAGKKFIRPDIVIVSDKTKELHSIIMRSKWQDKDFKDQQTLSRINSWTPERKAKASETMKNRPSETNLKNAASVLSSWKDQNIRNSRVEGNRNAWNNDPDRKLKMSLSVSSSWADPEIKAKRKANMSVVHSTPVARELKSKKMKEVWAKRKAID